MSVLQCHRNSCDEIICDRYSEEFGYICNECMNELIELGSATDVRTFMDSPKGKPVIVNTQSKVFRNLSPEVIRRRRGFLGLLGIIPACLKITLDLPGDESSEFDPVRWSKSKNH